MPLTHDEASRDQVHSGHLSPESQSGSAGYTIRYISNFEACLTHGDVNMPSLVAPSFWGCTTVDFGTKKKLSGRRSDGLFSCWTRCIEFMGRESLLVPAAASAGGPHRAMITSFRISRSRLASPNHIVLHRDHDHLQGLLHDIFGDAT